MHVLDTFEPGSAMRGEDGRSEGFCSYVGLQARIPADHLNSNHVAEEIIDILVEMS